MTDIRIFKIFLWLRSNEDRLLGREKHVNALCDVVMLRPADARWGSQHFWTGNLADPLVAALSRERVLRDNGLCVLSAIKTRSDFDPRKQLTRLAHE